MGHFRAHGTTVEAIGLHTQDDWRRFIAVIRRNTPVGWRQYSEFESVANDCLAEAMRSFDHSRGVPFEGFLARVAQRRAPEVLRRFAAKDASASTDDEWIGAHLDQRGEQADNFAPQLPDPIAQLDGMMVVQTFAETLSPTEREIVLLLAEGLTPAEVARHRKVGRSAIANVIARIRPRAEMLRAA